MDLERGAVVRQIARTGVLVAALGLVLYGAAALLAERKDGGWLLGLLLATPAAAFIGWVVVDALRSGVFPMRHGSATRADQPGAFWFNIGWFAACGGLLALLAGWCAMALLGG
jgi:hypothetical protein